MKNTDCNKLNKDKFRFSYKTQQNIILAFFLIVPLMLLFGFLLYPAFKLFIMSFTDWDGVLADKNFVGFENYKKVFSMKEAWMSLRNNLYYIANGFLQNIVALAFAVFLSSKIRGKNFFKIIIFITFIINSAAVGYMFNFFYDYKQSPINIVLNKIGLESVRFLSEPKLVNISIAMVSLWRYTGYTMMLYIAALQSINIEIYEAAIVDGANSWQRFSKITLPSIRRIIELNLFLTLSGGLQAFVEAFIMTSGGPGTASSTFLIYLIKTAFEYYQFGLAAALSFSLFIIILLVTVIQRKVVLRGED